MIEFIEAGLDAYWPKSLQETTGLAIPPFAPVVRVTGTTIYTSGQTYPVVGAEPTLTAAEASMEEQTRACLENVDLVLKSAGATRQDIVKIVIYNTRMAEQGVVNTVYGEFFGDHRPTRTHIEVTRLADPDLLIEIEAIAVID